MMGIVRSELVRLRRPRMLAAWFGLTALAAVMINTVMFQFAADAGNVPQAGPGVAFPTAAALAASDGIVAGLASASSMFGIITLSFWAISAAGDSSSGLIRLLVSAQPHRWRLVAGKVIALSLLTAVATTLALVVNVMAALPAAQAAGIDTSAWGTDLVPVLAQAWGNAFFALEVWGVIGLALAMLTRSSALAISIGVGYVLVVESIITMAADSLSQWLPGSTLTALAQGGTADISYGSALALGAGYVALGLVLATVVMTRRDITE